jgi:hypothetical protein
MKANKTIKSEGKGSLEKSRRNWEDNIKMYLPEIGQKTVDRIHLSQDGVQ